MLPKGAMVRDGEPNCDSFLVAYTRATCKRILEWKNIYMNFCHLPRVALQVTSLRLGSDRPIANIFTYAVDHTSALSYNVIYLDGYFIIW